MTGGKYKRSHGGGQSNTSRANIWAYVPHCVKDCHSCRTKTALLIASISQWLQPSSNCSKQCLPAVTEPPGELTYIVMSSFPEESRYKSCATTRLAMSSSIGPPRRTILCAARRGSPFSRLFPRSLDQVRQQAAAQPALCYRAQLFTSMPHCSARALAPLTCWNNCDMTCWKRSTTNGLGGGGP